MNISERVHSSSGILVYFEIFKNEIRPVSFELLGEAYRLSKKSNEAVHIVAVGKDINFVREKIKGFPVKSAYLYETDKFFQPDIYEKALEDCIDKLNPSIVLIGGTAEGRALAPRLAVNYRTGLTADCTELDIDENGNLLQIRPAFGGNIMAKIVTENTRPQFATVREKVMQPVKPDFVENTDFLVQNLDVEESSMKILNIEDTAEEDSIVNQNILVVAGRGVKKKEDLDMLRELAELLGGKLASSRALVEKGWMTHKEQIGLSGNTVCPKCMITFGVSGTVQFMAGMKTTPNIIAVNSDPNARIFEIAHYPICADLYDVVPELIKSLKGL